MALWIYKWRIWDHFYKANIPPKWWNCLLFLAFTTFGWVWSQFWKMENFTLYFTKGSRKKVRRHLERAHIDSKMCSGLLGATPTRIQPVIKPLRHFAHFVTRYDSISPIRSLIWDILCFKGHPSVQGCCRDFESLTLSLFSKLPPFSLSLYYYLFAFTSSLSSKPAPFFTFTFILLHKIISQNHFFHLFWNKNESLFVFQSDTLGLISLYFHQISVENKEW